MDSKEFLDALNLVAKEKGIDKEVVFEAIEASLVSACKKNFGTSQNIKVVIDRESGNVACYAQKTVASPVEDPQLEISGNGKSAESQLCGWRCGGSGGNTEGLRQNFRTDRKAGGGTEIPRGRKRNSL